MKRKKSKSHSDECVMLKQNTTENMLMSHVRHIKKSARKGDRIGFVTIEFKLDGTQLVSYSFGEKHYRGMEQIAVALERAKTSLLSRYIQ